jgi:hypothetical protein
MSGYTTYHPVYDQTKLAELTASMECHGWQGAPLIADGDQLITGAHRYPAALAAGIVPQIVDIRDIFPAWDDIHAEFGSPTADEYDYVCALEQLPAELRETYGIDAH